MMFLNEDWSEWDGGKVGGWPIWLDKVNIPLDTDTQCHVCKEPMSFLLEIYSPLDDNVDAFHRAIYLFCCNKASCVNANSVVALRSQLPQKNQFYVEDVESLDVASKPTLVTKSNVANVHLCGVCGCRSLAACGKCGKAHYCSKAHQKLDWKKHKSICANHSSSTSSSNSSSSSCYVSESNRSQCRELYPSVVFPEYSLVIEEENPDDLESLSKEIADKAVMWEGAMISAEDARNDGDKNITQAKYSEALGNEAIDEQ